MKLKDGKNITARRVLKSGLDNGEEDWPWE